MKKLVLGLFITGLMFVSSVAPVQAATLDEMRNTVSAILVQVNVLPSTTVAELQIKVNLLTSALQLQQQINALIAEQGGGYGGGGGTYFRTPVISSIYPASANPGARVTITGHNINIGDKVYIRSVGYGQCCDIPYWQATAQITDVSYGSASLDVDGYAYFNVPSAMYRLGGIGGGFGGAATPISADVYDLSVIKTSGMRRESNHRTFSVLSGATQSSLRVTVPNGGEQWQLGSTHTILWTPYDPTNNVNKAGTQVKAYLLKSENGNLVNKGEIIESGKASIHWNGDLGTYGNFAAAGDNYYVKLYNTVTGESDISDAPFKLMPAGTITANLLLNGSHSDINSVPATGQDFTATWTSNSNKCGISIGGVSQSDYAQYENLPGSGTRTVRLMPTSYGVSLWCDSSSPVEGFANDYINGPYYYNNGSGVSTVQVTSPNGGSLSLNTPTNITWSMNAVNKVSIGLYRNDASYAWIVRDMAVSGANGSYNWTPSSTIPLTDFDSSGTIVSSGAIYKIYIIGYRPDGTGTVEDKSDLAFSIVNPTTQTYTRPTAVLRAVWGSDVQIDWTNSSNSIVSSYVVLRKAGSTAFTEAEAYNSSLVDCVANAVNACIVKSSIPSSTSSYRDASAKTAGQYTYAVLAKYQVGTADNVKLSNMVYATAGADINTGTRPSYITNLTATVSGSNIVLNWTKPTGHVSYDIYRSTDSNVPLDNSATRAMTYQLNKDLTTYTDTTAVAGTTYYYRVVPLSASHLATGSNTNSNSNYASATVPSANYIYAIVVSPNGGENLQIGTRYTVSVNPGNTSGVYKLIRYENGMRVLLGDLYLTWSSQDMTWEVGKYYDPNTGAIMTAAPGTNYHVGFAPDNCGCDALDFSDGAITITSDTAQNTNISRVETFDAGLNYANGEASVSQRVYSIGRVSLYSWFEYGTSASNLNQSTTRYNVNNPADVYTAQNVMKNLLPGTTYYVRGVSEVGKAGGVDAPRVEGNVLSFTTPGAVAVRTWQASPSRWGPAYCNNNAGNIMWPQHPNSTYSGPRIERCYTTSYGQSVGQTLSEMTEADRNLTGQACGAYAVGTEVKTKVDPGYNYRCTE